MNSRPPAFPVRTYKADAEADFFLPGKSLVIECWRSDSRRGVALNWVEKNAAYVDFKFRRIKQSYPDVRCAALVEVMHTDPALVREYVEPVMEHADFMAYEISELAEIVRVL